MSLPPTLLEKPLPGAPGIFAGAGRRLSARKAVLVWLVLMSTLWLLLGVGAYAVIGMGE